MLSNISWSQYLVTIAILTVIWYIYVFLKFYASGLKLKLQNNERTETNHELQDEQMALQEELSYESSEEPANEFLQVEALIEELRLYIEADSKRTVINTELPGDLKRIILKYPNLKDTPYRSAINDLILAECARYGTETIEDDDVDGLWE